MPELFDTSLESRDAKGGRAHVHAAAAGAQVHRHSEDADFLSHANSPEKRREERTSRIYAIEHTREGYDFADVLGSANPCNRALQAQSESGVRHAAVPAQV